MRKRRIKKILNNKRTRRQLIQRRIISMQRRRANYFSQLKKANAKNNLGSRVSFISRIMRATKARRRFVQD